MQNENSILIKLLNKINIDLVQNYDFMRMRELSFIPINIQGDIFFIAVANDANYEKITSVVNPSSNLKIEFIKIGNERFKSLYGLLKEKLPMDYIEKHNEQNEDNFENLNPKQASALDIFSEDVSEVDEYIDEKKDEPTNELQIEENQSEVEDIQDEPEIEPSEALDDTIQKRKIDSVQAPTTKRIGEILIEEELITPKQLDIALAESKALDIPLGSVLVKLGYVSIQDLKDALGAQQGTKLATSEQFKAIPTVISVLPEDFIRTNKVIPLSMNDKSLVVGMVNPGDTKIINEIVYQTGLKPTVMMITHYEFENFIKTYFAPEFTKETTVSEEIMEKVDTSDIEETNEETLWEQVEKEIQDTKGSVSQIANNIITLGIDQHASDIHIEPRFSGYIVRYRVDGILKEVFKVPAKIDSQLIARFKVVSRMNIAEHRRCQDGNFTITYKGQKYDFRVNTLPVAGKEKMVIRILAPAITMEERKEEIIIDGASETDLEKVKYLISSPNGIILTSGPTGSGKTTTLYSLISYLNSESVNITTIEDPVEIKLDGVNQSSINTKAGITFATSLRAILRQDPDIILVGEIRDYETLEVAISASLTGHLVLSTIHTNSAAATITRLIEMGAKDYLISSTVLGVLAQRLVRKLCPECKEAYKPTVEEAKKILTDPMEIAEFINTTVYRPVGCPHCNHTGYAGRTGIFEILVVNKEIKKLIAQRSHDVVIEEYAVQNGMRTLRNACIDHIKKGITSIDEFVRILGLVTE